MTSFDAQNFKFHDVQKHFHISLITRSRTEHQKKKFATKHVRNICFVNHYSFGLMLKI